ncbi:MAG: translocation/assembly module TamB domain-containing protein [Spirosomataceae bacterium]
MKRTLWYIVNTLFILFVVAVLLAEMISLSVQFPLIQTSLVEYITKRASVELKHPTTIGRVNIKWFNAVSLEDVKILDRQNRPMIQVKRLDVNHDFWSLIWGKDKKTFGTYLDEATLYQPSVWLIKNPKTGDLNLDDFIARIEELTANPDAPGAKDQNVPFYIRKVHLIDGSFRWDDPRESRMTGKVFDYNHFTLKEINGEAKNFMVLGDTIALNIRNLRTFDKQTHLTVKELDTRFLYCRTKIELADLHTRIGNSVIGNYISFNYDAPSAFGEFNQNVLMRAHIDSSRVRSEDLGWFADYLFTLNETWRVHGNFVGTVNDFRLTETDLQFGKNSRLRGNMAFKGVTEFNTSLLDFDLKNTRVDAADLYQYYPEKSFNDLVQKFGVVDFSGKYKGTIDRFKLSGDFQSALGQINVREMEMNLAAAVPTYSADIKTQNFELGKLLDDDDFSQLDMNGKIKGRGFSVKNASLDLDSQLPRFTYNGYDYKNVYLRGNLQNKFFEGLVSVRDSNLLANVDGTFDFSGDKYSYHAIGKIDRANLQKLNFTKDSLSLHTELDVNLEGNSMDELVGRAKFLNSYATLKKRNLVVDTLLVDSRLSDGLRQLFISSEFFNFQAEGRFEPTKAAVDLAQLFKEYEMYFFGDENARAAYYETKQLKKPIGRRYSVDYQLGFKKMDRFLAFLYPAGYVSNGSKAEGVFTVDNTSIFSLTGQFDTLKIGNNSFYRSDLDLNTSKFTNSPEVLASAIINSEQQKLVGIAPTEKMDIEAAWEKDHIVFRSNLRQQNTSNRATLNGELRFAGDYLYLQFKKSKLRLLNDDWNLDANNLITIMGPEVTFSNVVLKPKDKDQLISLNGDISTDSLRVLAFETHNFELATLNPVLNVNLAGTANGSVTMRDLYRTLILDSKVNVQKLTYNNFLMGNLTGDGEWDPVDKHLHIDIHLDKNDKREISVNGTYTPDQTNNELDLKADFNETDLNLLEPFARGLVSDLSGRAVGTVTIKGPPISPVLDGTVDVKRGRLTFDYLKAVFAFEDKVYFGESDIRVKNLRLTDPEGNSATLRGGVYHDGFNKFSLGFDADMRNFKILGTTIRDNELFYGNAYATGKMEVFGPINNLNITADLTSNRGTKIYIPLDGAAEVASEDFVQFVSTEPETDTTGRTLAKNEKIIPAEESYIKMDFRLNITPDAYCEIQFDRQTGDAIRAYGKGLINLKIDTRDVFDMTGSYEIQNGDYLFTLQNVINKKFQIQKGSRISWTGDPYGATLDVKASYVSNVSLSPLFQSSTGTTQTSDGVTTRRYPVEVTIGLSDKMLLPQISYGLKFKEYPSDRSYAITAVEERLKRDEQYLSQQVSSMLLFGQLLSDQNNILAQSASGFGNSIGEMVSSQLNKWGSSLNENLELGVSGLNFNFSDPYTNALNNLQLRFSYRFLNDRFRITRDGRLSYGQNQYDATSLLLDWTLEYWLNDDGSQRLRMYNRNIQNQLNYTTGTPNAVSYGASYLFTRSFNSFRSLGPKETRAPKPLPKTDSGRLSTYRNQRETKN